MANKKAHWLSEEEMESFRKPQIAIIELKGKWYYFNKYLTRLNGPYRNMVECIEGNAEYLKRCEEMKKKLKGK